MKRKSNFILPGFVVAICASLASCTGARYLPEGETFYGGADIKFHTQQRIGRKKSLRRDLESYITPKPNGKVLGMRPGVWFYYIAGESKKKKGLRGFIRNKLGRTPVLLKDAAPQRTAATLSSQLYNEGYFKSRVRPEVVTKRKESKVIYHVDLEPPYRLREIEYPKGRDSTYRQVLRSVYETSLLKPRQRYQLDRLQAEQMRIEKEVENYGFYYFDDRYLIFEADSTVGQKQVDVALKLEPGIPKKARRIYHFRNVNVFPNYTLSRDTLPVAYDTLQLPSGYTYIDDADQFRPKIITNVINIRKGETYSRDAQDLTLSHLMGLGTFKFVNIKFAEVHPDSNALDANIYLTPLKKKSIRLEAQLVSKSNSFVGPGFLLTFTNRNFFRGAELFQFKANYSYEVQVGRPDAEALTAFEGGIEASLTIPRFISPIRIDYTSRRYLPKTQIKLGYALQNRVGYFRLNSFNLGYGYTWRETAAKTHELFPADISYVHTDRTSDTFRELVDANPVLASSFEDQFIVGTNYSFTLNTQLKEENVNQYERKRTREHNFYFNGTANVAGNLLKAIKSQGSGGEGEETYKLFGAPFSQFVRGDLDFRHYWQLDRHSKLASRLVLGAGYAYGNSTTLPYIKQFSIGGSNSIRAFPARSIGPGTFAVDPDSTLFIDQRGDIKLEGSVEYRFDIIKSLKGAVFTDAGNIWVWREEEARPGGEFTSDFLNQLAVGTGVGLRFDFSFFVLRLDVAFPLRRPDRGWVANEIDLGSSSWRGDNLIFNIAIGYPF